MRAYPNAGRGRRVEAEPVPDLGAPMLRPTRDRIYPRCVWCNGENYRPAVLAYSAGETPCAAAGGCGRYLPESYRREMT